MVVNGSSLSPCEEQGDRVQASALVDVAQVMNDCLIDASRSRSALSRFVGLYPRFEHDAATIKAHGMQRTIKLADWHISILR
jgi:hypothetical protein